MKRICRSRRNDEKVKKGKQWFYKKRRSGFVCVCVGVWVWVWVCVWVGGCVGVGVCVCGRKREDPVFSHLFFHFFASNDLSPSSVGYLSRL